MNTDGTPQQALGELLRSLLDSPEVQVISLSGPWGCGKTYLVDDVLKKNRRDIAKVSLFGIRNTASLKLGLLDDAVARKGGFRAWFAGKTRNDRDLYASAIEKLYAGASIGNELALIAFRRAVEGKLIVLDDIERRHADLSVDEIAGLIDELKVLSRCKILLIMNSRKMADMEQWSQVREKIVDRELTLAPSPTESTLLALPGHKYIHVFCQIMEDCGITNIRAIKRIAQETGALSGKKDEKVEDAIVRNLVAPLALMLGAHLRAHGPRGTLQDLSFNAAGSIIRDEAFNSAREMLNIANGNPYITHFDQLLRTGAAPAAAVAATLDEQITRADVIRVRAELDAVSNDHLWDIQWNDGEALDQLKQLCRQAAVLLDPELMSYALGHLQAAGGSREDIDAAAAAFAHSYARHGPHGIEDRGYHPRLHAALDERHLLVNTKELQDRGEAPPESDGRMRTIATAGYQWAAIDEVPLPLTVDSFLHQLATMSAADMRFVVPALCRLHARSDRSYAHWQASNDFMDACRLYVERHPECRRARLIQAALAGQQPLHQEKPARQTAPA